MHKPIYTYDEIKRNIEYYAHNTTENYYIISSEHDISQEDGNRLIREEGYDIVLEPSSPDSWRLKVFFDIKKIKRNSTIDKILKDDN